MISNLGVVSSRFILRWGLAPLLAAVSWIWVGSPCSAQIVVAGSPTYDSATGNGLPGGVGNGVNNSGVAVGSAEKGVAGFSIGFRAVRWDASGSAATELGHLGVSLDGFTRGEAYAVNDAGVAVGFADKWTNLTPRGSRAVRWGPLGTTAIELGDLGTTLSGARAGTTEAVAYDVNEAGVAVGTSDKYVSGNYRGKRAVRWNAAGTPTELGTLGTGLSAVTMAEAHDVNDDGTAVGFALKYANPASEVGERAVRWDALGSAATELGNLGTNASGATRSRALKINSAGTAVGFAGKYISGIARGIRAVRWDASGTAATELDNLGADVEGFTAASALNVNDAGVAVGYSEKYVAGSSVGYRAVRWDASGTAATELGILGVNDFGVTETYAVAVNVAGTAVGVADKYHSDGLPSDRAVVWLPDASVIDLNDLGVMGNPSGGTWLLTRTTALSSDGWVTGLGTFTPVTGDAYDRGWVAQVGFGGEWTDAFSGSLDGTWGRGPQWSTGTPAMQIGDATFNAYGAYTVALDRNERTHTITVAAGQVTLDFNGHSLEAMDAITVNNDATLGGAGTIVGDVTFNDTSTFAPGASAGTLTIDGRLALNAQIRLAFELHGGDGTVGGGVNDLVAAGGLTLDGILDVSEAAPGSFAFAMPGSTWRLFNYSGALVDHGLTLGALPQLANSRWAYAIDTQSPGQVNLVVVPEPSAFCMLLIGMLGLRTRVR